MDLDNPIAELFQKAISLGILHSLQFPEDLSEIPTDVKHQVLREILDVEVLRREVKETNATGLTEMRLHDVKSILSGAGQVVKVPGGWVYRFFENNQSMLPDGSWSQNYLIDSVFVPKIRHNAKYYVKS